MITQVYTEAHRCFYRHAREATSDEPILHAIRRSLRIGEPDDVLMRWGDPAFIKLRRGADWMTNANRMPDAMKRPEYIDPVDFVRWACERGIGFQPVNSTPQAGSLCHSGNIPKMLVGPAHGDLHGRNIIVGVVRGQAEWPAVFDFDKMDNDNIVAWDFAKLELELKCRVFHELLDTPDERRELRKLLKLDEKRPIPSRVKLSGDEQRVADRSSGWRSWSGSSDCCSTGRNGFHRKAKLLDTMKTLWNRFQSIRPLGGRCELSFVFDAKQPWSWALLDKVASRRGSTSIYLPWCFNGVASLKWHSANEHLAWKMIAAGVAAAACRLSLGRERS